MQAVILNAAAGVRNAFERLEARAARDPLDRVADQAVERLTCVIELTANLQALEAADAMTEALLDLRA